MAALHPTNTLNVEATLNQWVQTAINALDKPSWLPSFVFVFNMPDVQLNADGTPKTTLPTPCFSVYHLPVSAAKQWQGNHVGTGRGTENVSLMDLSCWVSRGDKLNNQEVWNAELMTMRAFVDQAFAGTSTIRLVDYLTDPGNPANINFKVVIERIEWDSIVDDPNPDIERARALIRYRWVQRS